MVTSSEERLRQLVDELDRLTPRDGACVRMEQYGGGPDEGRFVANQSGYLRFGIEFLKAGVAPQKTTEPSQWPVAVDIKYLASDESVIGFDVFVRDDTLELAGRQQGRRASRLTGFALAIVFSAACIAMLVFAVVGVVTVIHGM
jgi:hypothetical protein